MRRPDWAQRRRREAAGDATAAALVRAAGAVEANAARALRGRGSVAAAKPRQRASTVSGLTSPRVWHSDDGDGLDIACVLGGDDARSLLRIVLGGPVGDDPTPLERNIIRETVERLLAATGRMWEERSAQDMPAVNCWCCDLTIADAVGTTASMTLRVPAQVEPARPDARVDLGAVLIALEARLPAFVMRVDAIVRWQHGDLLTLSCDDGAAVRLVAGSTLVASGSLGAVRGRRAVRVTSAAAGDAR